MTSTNILRVDTSARKAGSISRQLSDEIVARFEGADVITRDLAATPLPQLSEGFVNLTKGYKEVELTDDQRALLALSDQLIAELKAADVIVIGLPVYNFGVPAALKAWIDLVARAGVTFRYTEKGPEGLLTGKRAVLAMASGGTQLDSAIDFATPYLRQVLGFMGVTDVEVVNADRLAFDAEGTLKAAKEKFANLAA